MNILINNKYQILETLGKGSFGGIFIGENINTYEKVAIKLQLEDDAIILRNEARMYNILNNISGVPILKTFGKKVAGYAAFGLKNAGRLGQFSGPAVGGISPLFIACSFSTI